jgi:tetratricopeptide (TPR) repeat protein
MMGYYLPYSGMVILDPSGKAMFQSTSLANSIEFGNWLHTEDKMKILSLLGSEKYEEYQNNIMLAQELDDWGLYGSAINVFSKTIEIFPDNPETYLDIAYAYIDWLKPREGIEYFQKALEHGSGVSEYMISSMINAYLQLTDERTLLKWLIKLILFSYILVLKNYMRFSNKRIKPLHPLKGLSELTLIIMMLTGNWDCFTI